MCIDIQVLICGITFHMELREIWVFIYSYPCKCEPNTIQVSDHLHRILFHSPTFTKKKKERSKKLSSASKLTSAFEDELALVSDCMGTIVFTSHLVVARDFSFTQMFTSHLKLTTDKCRLVENIFLLK